MLSSWHEVVCRGGLDGQSAKRSSIRGNFSAVSYGKRLLVSGSILDPGSAWDRLEIKSLLWVRNPDERGHLCNEQN